MTHHSHHHHGTCCTHSCCEQEEDSSCCCCQAGESENHHHHHHEHKSFSHQLLEMADEAWMEVLKEKMKEQIRTLNGPALDELAKIVTTSNNSRWKHKMGSQKASTEYEEKIACFFAKEKG